MRRPKSPQQIKQRVNSVLEQGGLFRVERFSAYRGKPVTPGSSGVATNAGSEVGRECRSGVFLETWNNDGSYQ